MAMPYQGFPLHWQQHLKGCHDQGAWRMRTGLLQRPKWRTRGQNLHWRRPVGDKDVGMAPRKRLMKERETLPAPGARPIAGPRTAPACRRSGRCHHAGSDAAGRLPGVASSRPDALLQWQHPKASQATTRGEFPRLSAIDMRPAARRQRAGRCPRLPGQDAGRFMAQLVGWLAICGVTFASGRQPNPVFSWS